MLESFLNKDAGLQDCNFIEKRHGAKVGPGPRDPRPPQSLKVRPQDTLQSLKVGPLHLSLINSFYSEYLMVFYLCVFFK